MRLSEIELGELYAVKVPGAVLSVQTARALRVEGGKVVLEVERWSGRWEVVSVVPRCVLRTWGEQQDLFAAENAARRRRCLLSRRAAGTLRVDRQS